VRRRSRPSHLAVAVVAALALAAIPGCGGGGDEGPPSVPAAGPDTPPSGSPGVRAGAPYDVDGRGWLELSQAEQFEAAGAFIEDHPERCADAAVGSVSFYATNSYGTDFPLDIAAADVLLEGCDAARQS
jgi:hypothetical protein